MFLVSERCPARRSGGGGGPNVIVGCAPPLTGRSPHLIEAAKRGRLDQMIFFSVPLTTRAPPRRPAGRPAERPAERPTERPATYNLLRPVIILILFYYLFILFPIQ